MDRKGSGIIKISLKYFRYFLSSGGRMGHSIHSPFVYELVRKVIFGKDMSDEPVKAAAYHRQMLLRREKISISDHGAGSRVTESSSRSIGSVARRSSVSKGHGAMLFRLCRWYKPCMVFEFGTGLGISTAYIAEGAGEVPLVSIEGSEEKHRISQALRDKGFHPELKQGLFEQYLEELNGRAVSHMILFLDGDHRYKPTLEFAKSFLHLEKVKELIIVLDDIYWSDGMEKAWKELCALEAVSISVDMFRMGMLIKRPGIEKQHFKIKK